jgi:hypothetical protein
MLAPAHCRREATVAIFFPLCHNPALASPGQLGLPWRQRMLKQLMDALITAGP